LNLSHNKITDNGAQALFRLLRINSFLKELSLSKNELIGENSFEAIVSLISGSILTPEDDGAIKAISKLLTESNKKIKDLNKKRKKLNLTDLPEVVIVKKDLGQKIDGQLTLCNRNLTVTDISLNPLKSEYIIPLFDNVVTKCGSTALIAAFGQCSLTLKLNLSATTGISTFPMTELKVLELSRVGLSLIV
jgi:hypothetical protein